ncbi:MAG: uL22 family ribosomal protein [Nanoarchaeota archaeon]|nr:uL22 family ribosomal protein [Nanoarchaeota archaeon]
MTEKDYNPERRNKKVMENSKLNSPKPTTNPEIKKTANQTKEEIKKEEQKNDEKKVEEKAKPVQKKPVVKKNEAIVRGSSLAISTKVSRDICKFIKNKKISDAVADLEMVIRKKKAVPMKGEIPHRKGKIMAGRFPKNASEEFVKMLKTLGANSNVNGLENPIITEAIANIAPRPFGKFGRVRRKRTHVLIKCKEKKNVTESKNKENKK